MQRIQPVTGVTIFYRDLNGKLFASTSKDFDSLESQIQVGKLMNSSGRFLQIVVMEGRFSSRVNKILTTIHYEKDYF